jgi:hypothetical protein
MEISDESDWPPIGSVWQRKGRTRVVHAQLRELGLVVYDTWSTLPGPEFNRSARKQAGIESWRNWVAKAQQRGTFREDPAAPGGGS